MPATRPVLLGLLSLFLALGCKGPGILTSLDDLTSHVDRQGFLDLQQQRILSLSGLVPDSPPGVVYRYHGDRSPFTAVGINTRGDGKSYVVVRTIENTKSFSDLIDIRDGLIEVRQIAAGLIRQRVERVAARHRSEDAAVALLDAEIHAKQRDLDKALADTQGKLDTPGLMVIRAETEESTSFAGRLGAILSLGADDKRERAGFALLAGLRTERLFVGKDLVKRFDRVGSDWSLIGRKFPYILGGHWVNSWLPIIYPGQIGRDNYYVPTSRLQAEYILYAQDSVTERRIEADIKATIEQLENLAELAKAEELELELILSSVASLGSVGVLGNVEEAEVGLQELFGEGGWHTVYAVMTELDDLATIASRHPRLHLFGFL